MPHPSSLLPTHPYLLSATSPAFLSSMTTSYIPILHLHSPIFHSHPPSPLSPFPIFPASSSPPIPYPFTQAQLKFCPLLVHPTIMNRKKKKQFFQGNAPPYPLQSQKINPHVSDNHTVVLGVGAGSALGRRRFRADFGTVLESKEVKRQAGS